MKGKVISQSICNDCKVKLEKYNQLTRELQKLAGDIKQSYDNQNPAAKRGRKRKIESNESVVETKVKEPPPEESNPHLRKSRRSRKPKLIQDYDTNT